jgi:hypothetical protein
MAKLLLLCEEEYWLQDDLMDEAIDSMIIHLGES